MTQDLFDEAIGIAAETVTDPLDAVPDDQYLASVARMLKAAGLIPADAPTPEVEK